MKKVKVFSILLACLSMIMNCCRSSAANIIRQPNEKEAEKVVKTFKGSISWNKFDIDLVRKNLKNIFITCEDDKMVACMRISVTAPKKIHINDLVTLKEARGKGYAKDLIEHLKQKFSTSSFDLTPTKRSIPFYQKQGFIYNEITNTMFFSPTTLKEIVSSK